MGVIRMEGRVWRRGDRVEDAVDGVHEWHHFVVRHGVDVDGE